MADALAAARQLSLKRADRVAGVPAGEFYVATIHRADTTDDLSILREVIQALATLSLPVVLPAHPRLRRKLDACSDLLSRSRISIIEPLGYIDMVSLVGTARAVFTDSGGLQKEAVWLGVPCVTLRDETEWSETLQDGYNQLVGQAYERILEAEKRIPAIRALQLPPQGAASRLCVEIIISKLKGRISGKTP
jgi:UDP-GlcNAc3NAcA epimerase